jgi:hypothetical protein
MIAAIELKGPLGSVMCRSIFVVFVVLSMRCADISWLMALLAFIGLIGIAVFLLIFGPSAISAQLG